MERKSIYTEELNDVISKIQDVILVELPNPEILPEYILLSILESPKSHAYLILDNFLMSNNLEGLRNTYTSVLKIFSQSSGGINAYHSNPVPTNELERLLLCAELEKDNTCSTLVGTEHVLLAILNPVHSFKQQNVLNEFGLEYQFVLDKCSLGKKKNETSRPRQISVKQPPVLLRSQVNVKALSSSKNSNIAQFTISLNQLVKDKKVDDLIGRDREINEIIKTMARRTKNNVILVGNGGCGKTQIVNGIASRIVNGDVPSILEGKEIVSLNILALISGTQLRGMFEERVKNLFEELQNSNRYILFIDDVQSVLKNGTKDKDTDMTDMLSNCLNNRNIIVIASTTQKDYRNAIESNPSISRKFQKIQIEPNSIDETIAILRNNKKYYERFHNVEYTEEAINVIPKLAERYITTRALPDSAFDILDMAGAERCFIRNDSQEIIDMKHRLAEVREIKENALNEGNFEAIDALAQEENTLNGCISDYNREQKKTQQDVYRISEKEITETVSKMTNIPIKSLTTDEKKKIAHIDQILKNTIIGQDDAIDKVCKAIKRNKVGLGDKNRVMASFFCIGNSGCGKSLLAKTLAKEIFGSEKDLVRIDMSEFSEKNSVAKLTGAAPGYIGYENGGQLTEAIKNKQHCVLLLDEIEKADQEIHNLFLQLLDEGRLTDSSGQLVNFRNVIVIMTSNIGAKQASAFGAGLGFVNDEYDNKKSIYEKELKKKFPPEFLNRIDQLIYFNTLTDENLKEIIKLEINKLNKRLNEIKYNIEYTDEVVDFLHSKAITQKEFGARPIIRLVQDYIEDKITDLLLEKDYNVDYSFKVVVNGNTINVE